MAVIDLANPTRFLTLVNRVLPWLVAATILAFAFGLVRVVHAPDDYQQGATVKIMFLHVPAAWLGMMGWGRDDASRARHAGMAPSAGRRRRQSGGTDRRGIHIHLPRHRLAVGPADLGHLLGVGRTADFGAGAVPALSRRDRAVATAEDPGRGSRAAAILTLVGAINLPIIKFSVDWWNTLHQPASVFRMGGSTIDPSILIPLLVMAGHLRCCSSRCISPRCATKSCAAACARCA
jgi:heme exporter protein C